jgi:hypothetical protein
MPAVAGFGFMRTIERKTYHKEEKRSRERSGQGVGEKLRDGFAFEDAPLEFEIEEPRRNRDGSAVGERKRATVGCVFVKSRDGWEIAPDGGLDISGEKGCLDGRHRANGNHAVGKGDGERK